MKRTLLIVALVAAVGVGVWYFLLRKRVAVAGPNNGQPLPNASVLPPVTPQPGQPGFSWTDAHAAAIGATVQGTCVAYGGGQLCDAAGKVGTQVGKVYSQTVQKAATTAWDGAKTVADKLKFW